MAAPVLTYAQLFSYQVAYRESRPGRQQGVEWERALLEVNFGLQALLVLDRERVITTQQFSRYSKYKCNEEEPEDTTISICFRKSGRWDVNVQNSAEKSSLLHLLESIQSDLSADEAASQGQARGIIGLNLRVLKSGIIFRKAKARGQRTERFVVVVPGKLLMFSGSCIQGRHTRYVTSLFQASVKMSYNQLQFQIIPRDSKEQDMASWLTALEESIQCAEEAPSNAWNAQASAHSSPSSSLSRRPQCPSSEDGEGQQRVSLSRQRLNSAIVDMTNIIGRMSTAKVQPSDASAVMQHEFRQSWRQEQQAAARLELPEPRRLNIVDKIMW